MSAVCNVNAQTLTLRAADSFTYKDSTDVVSTNWTDSITGNPGDSIGGGYWEGTYLDVDTLRFCDFLLSHNGNEAYNSWYGFTTGANGDRGNYGYRSIDHSGSVKWVDNQWGVMAGGGLDPYCVCLAIPGDPYFVAYWSYYLPPDYTTDYDAQTVVVSLADSALFHPEEVYICNHPWPYWGNIYGDGFAQPFDNDTCRFYLRIRAYNAAGDELGEVADTLAKGKTVPSCALPDPIQSPHWHRVDLSQFDASTQKLVFTMFSTDRSVIGGVDYGPNTAVYFNMDRLTVTKTGAAPAKAAVRKAKPAAPEKAPKGIEVKDYFPIPSYTGGEVTVYDAKGKVALKTTVKPGEKVNLSKLPKGEYRLRHGHKHLPVTKK